MKPSMKKLSALTASFALGATLFTGCAAPASGSSATSGVASASTASASASVSSADGNTLSVGLIQYVQHTSLDEINEAIQAQLSQAASAQGLTIDVKYQNAQGDMSTINTICQQFVASDVDLIIAIATPAALGAATAVEGTDIPVIFSAVTDPVEAELVESLDAPGGNITGTSDAIPVDKIFDLAAELTPDAKTFGVLYNTSEPNSVSVLKDVKAYLETKGMQMTEGAITSSGDVQLAAQNLLAKCDALFVPIDNTVATAMSVLAEEAIQAKKPVYVAADSMVKDGGLASVGVNYTNLGKQTADMALKILTGTAAKDIPVEVLKENNIVVNSETAAAIGVDVSKYAK